MKAEHEFKFKENPFLVNDEKADRLAADIEEYWNVVDQLNNLRPEEVRIEINPRLQVIELLSEMRLALENLKSFNDFLQNSVGNKEFETLFIGIPNWLTRLEVLIHQAEVKYLEEKAIQNPENKAIRDDYELARALFAIITPNKCLVD